MQVAAKRLPWPGWFVERSRFQASMDGAVFDEFTSAVVTIAFEHGVGVLHPRLIGEVGDGFPSRGPVHIVTAYNPRGPVSDKASNAARHRALLDHVETIGVESFTTVGSGADGSMRETECAACRLGPGVRDRAGSEIRPERHL